MDALFCKTDSGPSQSENTDDNAGRNQSMVPQPAPLGDLEVKRSPLGECLLEFRRKTKLWPQPGAKLTLYGNGERVGMFFSNMGKARRDETVEACIRKAVASGKDHAVFDDLAFSAAHSYAIDHGALAPERDAASTRFAVGGTTYFVVFMRARSGGTVINAEDRRLVSERVMDRSKMEVHLHKTIMSIKSDFDALSRQARYDQAERLTVKDIQDEVVKVPSWGLEEVRMQGLISATIDAAIRSGMDETLARRWLRKEDVLTAVLTSAAQFEIAGFTQSEQVDCVCTFTEKLTKAQLKAQARSRT